MRTFLRQIESPSSESGKSASLLKPSAAGGAAAKWALAVLGAFLLAAFGPGFVRAQYVRPAGMASPDDQRNALNAVRGQVGWLQNATRTAPGYGPNAYEMVARQFRALRLTFNGLKSTLTPQQLMYGGNDLAELEAGLDILEEAFAIYQEEVGAGRAPMVTLRSMCDVLARGSVVWVKELEKVGSRMRIGW